MHNKIFALLVSFFALPAMAHHAFLAEFDANMPVLLQGKISKIELINPHSWIHLVDSKTKKKWMVEAGTPNTLLRAGIDQNSLKVGTEVIVQGFRSRDQACNPECKANGRNITLSNGTSVFVGSEGTGAPETFPGGAKIRKAQSSARRGPQKTIVE